MALYPACPHPDPACPSPPAAPTTFSNLYFVELTENKWHKKKWKGPLQYEDKSGQLMMVRGHVWGDLMR